jgi:hypothetical protein
LGVELGTILLVQVKHRVKSAAGLYDRVNQGDASNAGHAANRGSACDSRRKRGGAVE